MRILCVVYVYSPSGINPVVVFRYSYYHYFSSMQAEMVTEQRLATFLDFQLSIDDECAQFEADAAALLEWIELKTHELSDLAFPNSFDAVKAMLDSFKTEYQAVSEDSVHLHRITHTLHRII